jgi:hypothetical protein
VNEDFVSSVKRAKVCRTTPSQFAKPTTYEATQLQSTERILDDQPQDDAIPPISLLYDGFGGFLDIMAGSTADVEGYTDVNTYKLRLAVDEFSECMCQFFEFEEQRKAKGLGLLNKIFATRHSHIHPELRLHPSGSWSPHRL